MPVRTTISERQGLYFITITCARWLPLIEIVNGYDLIYNWFDYLKKERHKIVGYVIMRHHFHVLIAFVDSPIRINTVIGNGKRFMAYKIVDRLKSIEALQILDQLGQWVNNTDRKRNKIHEVFEPSFDWKPCLSQQFIRQKLTYIHDNPCKTTPPLAVRPWEYEHSSAKFYLEGINKGYPVTSFMELDDLKFV